MDTFPFKNLRRSMIKCLVKMLMILTEAFVCNNIVGADKNIEENLFNKMCFYFIFSVTRDRQNTTKR